MKESFEYKGYWYLPEFPQNKVAGIFTYLPYESVKLELIGGFNDPVSTVMESADQNRPNIKVILGETGDSKLITLIDCSSSASINFDSSFVMTVFSVRFMLEGIHLEKQQDLSFYSIQTSFPLLNSWVNYFKINQSYTWDEKNGFDKINLSFSYADNQTIMHAIDKDTSLFIRFGLEYKDERSAPQMKQVTFFDIETKNNHDFLSLLNHIYRLKSFLSLATLSPSEFDFIHLNSKERYQELTNGKRIEKTIHLYYKELKPELSPDKKRYQYLFDYQDVKSEFPVLIRKWFHASVSFAPIRQHLIDSILPKKLFKSGDFLIVVQALEGFHRRFRNKDASIYLKTRLKELITEFADVQLLKRQVIDLDQVVASRNYYSHFFQKNKNVQTGQELYQLTNNLRLVLICCVLKEIGLDNQFLDKVVDKNKFSV